MCVRPFVLLCGFLVSDLGFEGVQESGWGGQCFVLLDAYKKQEVYMRT